MPGLVMMAIITFPMIIPIALMMFDSWDDFFDAIRLFFTPDIISAFAGEWHQDQWNTMKLYLLLFLWGTAALSANYKWGAQIATFAATVGL